MLASPSYLRMAVSRSVSIRSFSSCEPAQRLKSIFEDYRQKNYSRETPSRFKKEIIKALADPTTSTIEIDSLNQILVNIGRPQDKLSEADLSLLLAEAGVEETQRSIPVDKIIQLM